MEQLETKREPKADVWPIPPVSSDQHSSETKSERVYLRHQVLAGQYRLEDAIARGGMGWVFEATQLSLQRRVAIKVLAPDRGANLFRRRFLLEASVSARLAHPNIITVHDYGQTADGDLFIAMEYLDGTSLSKMIASEGVLEPLRVAAIGRQICRALKAAHREGVVHRDLKPGNVMIMQEQEGAEVHETVKVVDFGLLKMMPRANTPDLELTQGGAIIGSPHYMSPEQILGDPLDARADIYALGVLLYFMLTGNRPFTGAHTSEVLSMHLRERPPAMSKFLSQATIPEALEAIVQKCLEKLPEKRFQSADEVLEALKQFRSQAIEASLVASNDTSSEAKSPNGSVQNRAVTSTGRRPRRPYRSWAGWLGLGAMLVISMVLGASTSVLQPSATSGSTLRLPSEALSRTVPLFRRVRWRPVQAGLTAQSPQSSSVASFPVEASMSHDIVDSLESGPQVASNMRLPSVRSHTTH